MIEITDEQVRQVEASAERHPMGRVTWPGYGGRELLGRVAGRAS